MPRQKVHTISNSVLISSGKGARNQPYKEYAKRIHGERDQEKAILVDLGEPEEREAELIRQWRRQNECTKKWQ